MCPFLLDAWSLTDWETRRGWGARSPTPWQPTRDFAASASVKTTKRAPASAMWKSPSGRNYVMLHFISVRACPTRTLAICIPRSACAGNTTPCACCVRTVSEILRLSSNPSFSCSPSHTLFSLCFHHMCKQALLLKCPLMFRNHGLNNWNMTPFSRLVHFCPQI